MSIRTQTYYVIWCIMLCTNIIVPENNGIFYASLFWGVFAVIFDFMDGFPKKHKNKEYLRGKKDGYEMAREEFFND